MEQSITETQPQDSRILDNIQNISNNMTGWLKFLGVMNIISGALSALSLFGIIIAWLPIWLGILLFQAGNRISNARYTNNRTELVQMMDKLRLYFVIQGILIIVMIAVVIIGFFVFGSFIAKMAGNMHQF